MIDYGGRIIGRPTGGGGSGGGGGIEEAPMTGDAFARRNAGWQQTPRTYTHTQSAAAATWNIQHNFGKKEVWSLTLDDQGIEIIGSINWTASTVNLLVINFSDPVAGTAYIKY